MKKVRFAILSFVTGFICPLVYGQQSQTPFNDPDLAAVKAAEVENFSLLGIAGFVVRVPGIKGMYESISEKFNVKIIEGTSDAGDLNRGTFYVDAERFAFRYNRRMFEILGCDPERPNDACLYFPRQAK